MVNHLLTSLHAKTPNLVIAELAALVILPCLHFDALAFWIVAGL